MSYYKTIHCIHHESKHWLKTLNTNDNNNNKYSNNKQWRRWWWYNDDNNKDQSILAKSEIARASTRKVLFVFARCQIRTDGLTAICNCIIWLGVPPQNLIFPWGFRDLPSNRMCTCQMTSSVEQLNQWVSK